MRCPACAKADLLASADLGPVPVLSGYTWDTAQDAAATPVGRMELAYCPFCAHVVNTAFDERLMSYDGAYDNSLHHSPAFAGYATELAKHLAETYQLSGRTVLELGCGKGEFLRELCRTAGARGVGFDVSYQGSEYIDEVRFIRGFLRAEDDVPPVDFVVCRHVLEHLNDPHAFLADLRDRVGEGPVRGYLEVPDARYDLSAAGWGCIYPHVAYFTEASLSALLRRSGFTPLAMGTSFNGAFRYAEIVNSKPVRAGPELDIGADLAAITSLGRRHRATVAHWQGWITKRVAAGHPLALWGAGARGVAFLYAVDPQRGLSAVVDRNPAKHGRYLPVTAHRVIAPAELAAYPVSTVLITNPTYRVEIIEQLAELGVSAEVTVVTAME